MDPKLCQLCRDEYQDLGGLWQVWGAQTKVRSFPKSREGRITRPIKGRQLGHFSDWVATYENPQRASEAGRA